MTVRARSFHEISEECVKSFLHTVVVIDDQAFLPRHTQPTEGLDTPGLPMPGAAQQGDAHGKAQQPEEAGAKPPQEQQVVPQDAPGKEVAAVESAVAVETPDFDLDSEEVIRLFAKTGIVCAVLQPEAATAGGHLRCENMPAATRADALILDWRIHDTDGDHALSLIRDVLEVDKKHSGRLRLILIYTAEPDLSSVHKQLSKALAEDKSGVTVDPDYLTLNKPGLRIAVLAKPTSLLKPEWKKHIVDLEDLPSRMITEFAKLTSGLVSNVALESLAVLRKQTHTLLAQLGRDLDAAYLTHRALLPNPDDSIEHVADLVAGEIGALLQAYEVGKISGAASVEAWVNQRSEYTLYGKRLASAQVVELIRDGRAALRWAGKEGAENFTKQFGIGKKKVGEHLTSMLVNPPKSPQDIDHQFTVRTSMVSRYEVTQPAPWLRLGAILQSAQRPSQYWVCVQPPCHCVRLGGQRRAFLFAPSTTDEKFDLEQFVPDGESFRRLGISLKSYELKTMEFIPTDPGDVVRAQVEGARYFFTCATGTKYWWVGQMKDMYAQRVANLLGNAIAKVALNEYEWARRPDE